MINKFTNNKKAFSIKTFFFFSIPPINPKFVRFKEAKRPKHFPLLQNLTKMNLTVSLADRINALEESATLGMTKKAREQIGRAHV